MANNKIKVLTGILFAVGALLVAAAVVLALVPFISQRLSESESENTVEKMLALIPKATDGFPGDRGDEPMPSLEISGENYCALLEIPACNTTLAVRSGWDAGEIYKYPCRYTGSMYNSSLVIGGGECRSVFGFLKAITEGDKVTVTDTAGERYSYAVSEIELSKDVSEKTLCESGADLVLFGKDEYSTEYTIIRCKLFG